MSMQVFEFAAILSSSPILEAEVSPSLEKIVHAESALRGATGVHEVELTIIFSNTQRQPDCNRSCKHPSGIAVCAANAGMCTRYRLFEIKFSITNKIEPSTSS